MVKPLLSIIIPAYNHAEYLKETMESIWEQNYTNLEIIVIDDGSTDDTYEVAKRLAQQSPFLTIVGRQENKGINKTINYALSLAKGELIAFIASDDKFAPNRFDSSVEVMVRDPEVHVVFANGRTFSQTGLGERVHNSFTQNLLEQDAQQILNYLYTNVPHLFAQTCLYRKSFLQAIGGMDERMIADDWVLNIRVFQQLTVAGKFRYIDEDVIYYRQHETNSYKNYDTHSRRILEVIEVYTPDNLKQEAKANILWHVGLMALTRKKFSISVKNFVASQLLDFKPVRMLQLIYKVVRKLNS